MSLRGTLGIAGVALTIAFPGIRAASPVEPEKQFEGEYGLYVRYVEDGLQVGWLTDEPKEGILRAYVDDGLVAEKTTAAAGEDWHPSWRPWVHSAVVELDAADRESGSVVLEYGRLDEEPLHRSRIHLESPLPEPTLVHEAVDSIYVIGDSHGEFDTVVGLLRNAGLVDAEHRWAGGNRHLVMLGDLFDRGEDVTRLLWFLYGLERQAEDAGGHVHIVLGNHEIMVMIGDVRYVSGKEHLIAQRHAMDYSDLFDPHASVLGRWLTSKPAAIRIDDVLFAHGGMGPRYAGYGLEELQDTLRLYMQEELFPNWHDDEFLGEWAEGTTLDSAAVDRRWTFFNHRESVFWYRDLVQSDTLGPYLDKVLKRFDSRIHVVGHTPLDRIEERYDGRLIAVDMEEAATELLLLVRNDGDGWDRMKLGLEGPVGPIVKDTAELPSTDSKRPPR
jgi:hypothetical protein